MELAEPYAVSASWFVLECGAETLGTSNDTLDDAILGGLLGSLYVLRISDRRRACNAVPVSIERDGRDVSRPPPAIRLGHVCLSEPFRPCSTGVNGLVRELACCRFYESLPVMKRGLHVVGDWRSRSRDQTSNATHASAPALG